VHRPQGDRWPIKLNYCFFPINCPIRLGSYYVLFLQILRSCLWWRRPTAVSMKYWMILGLLADTSYGYFFGVVSSVYLDHSIQYYQTSHRVTWTSSKYILSFNSFISLLSYLADFLSVRLVGEVGNKNYVRCSVSQRALSMTRPRTQALSYLGLSTPAIELPCYRRVYRNNPPSKIGRLSCVFV